MSETILVLNSGSSSLKFSLFALPGLDLFAWGVIEEIGAEESPATLNWHDGEGELQKLTRHGQVGDHSRAVALMGEMLRESAVSADIDQLAGIGHRVVHGGEAFHEPVRIDERVLAAIEELVPLAPLHNPANLTGIRVALERAPQVPQVAVFDTAFHQRIPEHAYLYALPRSLYEKEKVRRYGFHGTSHSYVCARAAEFLGRDPGSLALISLHLGNGASAAAVQGGRCVDTSMGMTPLEGLIMGTRSGDLDPAILFYLARETGMGLEELDRLLNRESGLKGICGESDMRTITRAADQGDSLARLALDMFCYRLKKYIGAYAAVLNGVDAILFTGGIGENSAQVRAGACSGLDGLGIRLDAEKNSAPGREILAIQHAESRTVILVVPTDEEYEIASLTRRVLESG